MGKPSVDAKVALRRNEKKWTPELMAAGWTAFPSIILEKQRALGLDALDVNILLQLAKHWWESDNPPFPSKGSIAQAIGVDSRTVQRRIAEMEKGGFITRSARVASHGGNKTNVYLFTGLIEKVKGFAQEAVEERARHAKEREERRTRRRPAGIHLVRK